MGHESDRYHLLVENMSDAFAHHRIILDEQGNPIDCEFVHVNSAFEEMVGLKREQLTGKKAAEVLPGFELYQRHWLNIFGQAALTGESTRFEEYSKPFNRWYEVTAYCDKPGYFITVLHDITRQKFTAEKLQKKKGFLQNIINNMFDLVSLTDLSGSFKFLGPSHKILGYDLDSLIGRNVMEFVHPEDLPEVSSAFNGFLSGESQEVFDKAEYRYRCADGSYLWFETVGKLLLDKKGNPQEILFSTRDVTERKQAEEALRQSKTFIKTVIDNLPIGIAVNSVDPAVNFEYINDNFLNFYRISRDDLTDPDTFWEVVYEDAEFREKIKKRVLEDCASGDPGRMKWEKIPVAQKGKETFYITAKNIPIPDTPLMISTVRDVTEQKQYERALKESEQNLFITLQSIGDGVIATDSMGHVTRMNLQAEKLTGWTHKEAEGRTLSEIFTIISSKTEEAAVNPAERVLKTGNIENLAGDTILIARDGTRRQISDSAAPIRNSAGVCTGVVMVFSDITEQYRIREALRQSEEKYRLLIENQTDLVVKMDPRGNFLFVSPAYCDLFGKTEEELLGKNIMPLVYEGDRGFTSRAMKKLISPPHTCYFEQRVYTRYGLRWVGWADKAVVDTAGKVTAIVGIGRDITTKKQAEKKIFKLSFLDSLTDLYNRAYIEEEMQRLDTKRQFPISIIMADLNGLKLVNDTYGHSVGDEMLVRSAETLKKTCRREDIIARWSGDEFVIFLPQTTLKEAWEICKRIVEECSKNLVETVPLSMALGTASKNSMEQDLSETLKEAEDNMYKNKLAESRSTKSAVLNALLNTLEEKSFETEEHSKRMQKMAIKIGKRINLPETELDRLTLLVYLHDIGKITVPEEVLTKMGRLTEKDWEHIKKHPESGYRIARSMEEFAHVAEDILCHHEHWNGSGYPKGLKGKEIPLLARIVNIVDAYEVMTHGRPYKKLLSKGEVVAELKRCAGTQFDPELVEVFLGIVEG